jgi:hypothetical protein
MRVNIAPLMDKGLKRRSKAMPETADLKLEADEQGRPVLVGYRIGETAVPILAKLYHPQLADVGKRGFFFRGYELDRDSGQLFAQAWEVEPVRR